MGNKMRINIKPIEVSNKESMAEMLTGLYVEHYFVEDENIIKAKYDDYMTQLVLRDNVKEIVFNLQTLEIE